jgi:two-component system alkaline phosphatase synthesis response regulator PhoP
MTQVAEAGEGIAMRVLVVDDSPVARIALRGMLQSEGFIVIEADDGHGVTELAARVKADLVLCDMFMPTCDGVTVIRELHRKLPHVKIIAISGAGLDGRMDMLPMALRLGADDVLYKPFSPAALQAAVTKVMAKPQGAARAASSRPGDMA